MQLQHDFEYYLKKKTESMHILFQILTIYIYFTCINKARDHAFIIIKNKVDSFMGMLLHA